MLFVVTLGSAVGATRTGHDQLTVSSDELYEAAAEFTARYPIGDQLISTGLMEGRRLVPRKLTLLASAVHAARSEESSPGTSFARSDPTR